MPTLATSIVQPLSKNFNKTIFYSEFYLAPLSLCWPSHCTYLSAISVGLGAARILFLNSVSCDLPCLFYFSIMPSLGYWKIRGVGGYTCLFIFSSCYLLIRSETLIALCAPGIWCLHAVRPIFLWLRNSLVLCKKHCLVNVLRIQRKDYGICLLLFKDKTRNFYCMIHVTHRAVEVHVNGVGTNRPT